MKQIPILTILLLISTFFHANAEDPFKGKSNPDWHDLISNEKEFKIEIAYGEINPNLLPYHPSEFALHRIEFSDSVFEELRILSTLASKNEKNKVREKGAYFFAYHLKTNLEEEIELKLKFEIETPSGAMQVDTSIVNSDREWMAIGAQKSERSTFLVAVRVTKIDNQS